MRASKTLASGIAFHSGLRFSLSATRESINLEFEPTARDGFELQHLKRGLLLLERRNYQAALKEFEAAVIENPDDSYARALLANCLVGLGKADQALDEVEKAISLDPQHFYPHYTRSVVQLSRGNLDQARVSCQEALRIEPYSDVLYGQLASLFIYEEKLKEALEAAETGLSLNPDESLCINARARALVGLGRAGDAEVSLISSLQKEPDNPYTHTNLGWVLLRRGAVEESMTHFKEALRLDPNDPYSREGVVESMKSRNPVYHVLLKTTLWFQGLHPAIRVAMLIAFVFIPLFRWFIAFLLLPVLLSDQVFNTVLRLDPYGRIVLTEEQIKSNNIFLGFLAFLVLIVVLTIFFPELKGSL